MTGHSNKKHFKKKIIITLSVAVGLLLLMYALTLILPLISEKLKGNPEEEIAKFNFYEPDFEENIFDDPEYLLLIENGIIQYDNASNSIVTITDENVSDHGEPVELLANFVDSIIDGDHERYNGYFSKEYLKENSPKDKFTMQKIYNCLITFYRQEDAEDKNGNYTKYIYKLKYQIYENNGTFRRDIGEDYKTQYIVITDREEKLLIDAISTSNYK